LEKKIPTKSFNPKTRNLCIATPLQGALCPLEVEVSILKLGIYALQLVLLMGSVAAGKSFNPKTRNLCIATSEKENS